MSPKVAISPADAELRDAAGSAAETGRVPVGCRGGAVFWCSRLPVLISLALVSMVLIGCCGPGAGGLGIALPPGDIRRGEAAFRELQCYFCHSVSGHHFPPPWVQPPVVVVLGTESHAPNRRELVNSIINPSHRIYPGIDRELVQTNGVSRMKNFSEVMTVQQLSDLVAFLETLHR